MTDDSKNILKGSTNEEQCELIQGGYVSLSFGSFNFLKKKFKTITGTKDGELIDGPIVSLEPIHKKKSSALFIFQWSNSRSLDGF